MENIITIVSGLPRSGTSMMMSLLQAGGMEIITDNIRKADEDNPKGYFEFEKVKKIKEASTWLKTARGKAFKMVSMLLYDLPGDMNYKIIFLKRDMDEVLASQGKMLQRIGKQGSGVDDAEMGRLYQKHHLQIEKWLKAQDNINTLYVNYNEMIENPTKNIEKVSSFFDNRLNSLEMLKIIDKSLYRNRSNQPG